MHRILLAALAVFLCHSAQAQTPADTLAAPAYQGARAAWRQNFSYAGLPMLAAGLIMQAQQKDHRALPRTATPRDDKFYDDALPYTPLAATALLKACGVETRSSWLGLAGGSAASAVIMVGALEGIKKTADVPRPDGSDYNSFPSGHTATAFMAATIMHKELGQKSPWYSIAAYTAATATGLCRALHSKHWANDVVFGAGLGITATDLGYFLSDIILRDKALNKRAAQQPRADLTGRPSFFSIGMTAGTARHLTGGGGILAAGENSSGEEAVATGQCDGAGPLNLQMRTAATLSLRIEGAYFFNSYLGLGATLSADACPVTPTYNAAYSPFAVAGKADGSAGDTRIYRLDGIESACMGIVGADLGLYGSLPLGRHWRVGGKLTLGDRYTTPTSLDGTYSACPRALLRMREEGASQEQCARAKAAVGKLPSRFLHIDGTHAFAYGAGLDVMCALGGRSALRLSADYAHSRPTYHYTLAGAASYDAAADCLRFADTHTSVRATQNDINIGAAIIVLL